MADFCIAQPSFQHVTVIFRLFSVNSAQGCRVGHAFAFTGKQIEVERALEICCFMASFLYARMARRHYSTGGRRKGLRRLFPICRFCRRSSRISTGAFGGRGDQRPACQSSSWPSIPE